LFKHSSDGNKGSDHQGWDVLILRQILLTSSIRNVWRTVRRVCILMIRLMIMDAAADEKEEVENKG